MSRNSRSSDAPKIDALAAYLYCRAWERNFQHPDWISEREYFSEIVDLVLQPLRAYAFYSLGLTNPAEAEDLAQEVLLGFLRTKPTPDLTRTSLLTWLFQAARWRRSDMYRKASVRNELPLTALEDVNPNKLVAVTKEKDVLLSIALQRAIQSLPDTIREAAVLCLVWRYTQTETAVRLNLTEKKINSYIERAKTLLKTHPDLKPFFVCRTTEMETR